MYLMQLRYSVPTGTYEKKQKSSSLILSPAISSPSIPGMYLYLYKYKYKYILRTVPQWCIWCIGVSKLGR